MDIICYKSRVVLLLGSCDVVIITFIYEWDLSNSVASYRFKEIFNFSVRRKWILPLTVVSWMLFIYFFWKIGDPFPILSARHGKNLFYDFLNFLFSLVKYKEYGVQT